LIFAVTVISQDSDLDTRQALSALPINRSARARSSSFSILTLGL